MTALIYSISTTTAVLLETPEQAPHVGRRESQLLFGETFRAAGDRENGHIKGVSEVDGYEGYIHESFLEKQTSTPTHFTDVLLTHIYPEPDFKTRPVMALSFLSRLAADDRQGNAGFLHVHGKGWIFAAHIKPISAMFSAAADPVATALRFLETPYIYGGRSAAGIDCSGLVQMALLRAGLPCPRDADQQELCGPGNILPHRDLRRGDIVFFKGHTGIMIDRDNIVNATARHMGVKIEPLKSVSDSCGGVTSVRRL